MKRVVFLGAAAATLVQFTKYDLTALQTLGCEIHMVCNMQNGNLSEAALHEYNQTFPQLHWHDLPFADSAAALRRNHQAYQKLLPLLKELKPDLLHCHGTIAGQYGRRAAQELGIPVFYTAHDFRVFHGCLLAERVYFSAVERKYRKATEVFFAVCPEDAAYAKKHLNQAEVVSLPDVGLDCDKYAMPERSREVVRNELDIPQDAVVLLSVGTLRMQKRLRVILQAMARLRNREQLHYVICGEGPDMPFLQKLKQEFPEKTVWAYTGFVLEDLMTEGTHPHCEITETILSLIDVLIDGRFVEAKKDLSLQFRGSSNQRIIDLKKTLAEGRVILWEDPSKATEGTKI